MKTSKKVLVLIVVAFVLFSSCATVLSYSGNAFVVDEVNSISTEELETLNAKMSGLSNKYGYDIIVLLVGSCGEMTTQDYAEAYYTEHAYNQDSITLLVNYELNEWYIYATGSLYDKFNDEELNALFDKFYQEETNFNGVNNFADAIVGKLSENAEGVIPDHRLKARLVDEADLLDATIENRLLGKLDEISERQGCDIAVVTVYSLQGKTATEFADDYYDYNGYGMGSGYNGILLLLAMEERDWAVSTFGYCKTAFTDAGLEYIMNEVVPWLSRGEYFGAFDRFADYCDDFITHARNGSAYDVGNLPKGKVDNIWLIGCPLIGIGLAFIPMSIMKGKHKTVKSEAYANNYIAREPVLTNANEFFLYSTMTRVRRPEQSNFSGGSGTHISSSGRSHGGISGKF